MWKSFITSEICCDVHYFNVNFIVLLFFLKNLLWPMCVSVAGARGIEWLTFWLQHNSVLPIQLSHCIPGDGLKRKRHISYHVNDLMFWREIRFGLRILGCCKETWFTTIWCCFTFRTAKNGTRILFFWYFCVRLT